MRVAIVTGAAAGIGAATAARLLADGFHVCAVDRAEPDAPAHENRLDLVEDLVDPAAPARIVGAVLERFGRVDVLVNNAGVGGARAVHETDDAGWSRIIETNLTTAFRMSREVLPDMLARGAGCIIHVASALS